VISGNYTVFAAAANSAGWSKLKSTNFAIARKHVKVHARRGAKRHS
jgi:hypothetical protein